MTEPTDASPSLRERNRRATRSSVIDACASITREKGRIDFSMPEVAARAGVSLRTLYRYFATRQDLIDALATVADQVVAAAPPHTLDGLEQWLTTAWKNLLQEEALMRAQHLGASGAEVRRARVPFHRSVVDVLLTKARPELTKKQRTDLADVVLLLSSSTALFEFIDVIDVSVERAAQLAALSIRTLVETHHL